jgi:N-methylhydantoinase A
MWRVGVDVGGTFTDLFAWEETTGKRVTAKVLTTKSDRSQGVIQAIEAAQIPFTEISHLIHGTTAATNALLERSYPDPALITTDGFRDTIEIGRQHRQHLYDPYQTKPKPIIRRRNRHTVPERMNVGGDVERPLNREAAAEVAQKIADAGIKSIAIAFINSYVNDAHEQEMREILLEHIPDAHVVLSGETRPVFREHGRFSTTAVRAALMPVMVDFFDRLRDGLKGKGFVGALMILKSSGGVAGVELAKNHPEELLESGPAGGVAYAAYLSQLTEYPNFIHTDMGGTSFDASIVEDGKGLLTREYELEWEIPVIVPMLDIHSVGAGGGSIGWVDEGGSLRVGPRSAGSEPGPACYGRGGTEATITDANLLLGRLEPTLGGKLEMDRNAAETAIKALAQKIGLSPLETAEGMIRISCENMAQAVKMVLVARGRDPRDFVLASFGGAGAMHTAFVAEAMNIPKMIVPAYAGVASAFGATAMDLRQDVEAFMYAPLDNVDLAEVNGAFDQLEENAKGLLAQDGVSADNMVVTRSAQMRYVGQTYEVEAPIPSGTLSDASLKEIAANFDEQHQLEHGVSSGDFQPALVSLCVTAAGTTVSPPPAEKESGASKDVANGARQVYFNGKWEETKVLRGEALSTGDKFAGPAIVEYDDACAVLPPATSASVDEMHNLVIELGG